MVPAHNNHKKPELEGATASTTTVIIIMITEKRDYGHTDTTLSIPFISDI